MFADFLYSLHKILLFQTLNKEQGIEWIKAHRLPAFLESDCYMEYRLAKLISQSQVSSHPEEYISMQIDYTPPVRKTKKEDEEEQPKVDVREVSLGGPFSRRWAGCQ